MKSEPRPHGPVFPRTGEQVRLALRSRLTWRNAPESVRVRFVSLYIRGAKITPDDDVTTAWVWYYRGLMWEGPLRGEEKKIGA